VTAGGRFPASGECSIVEDDVVELIADRRVHDEERALLALDDVNPIRELPTLPSA
jgi:hypothetical protein